MEIKDTVANTTTFTGVGMYVMHFQTELTVLLLLTGVILNLTRIYDWYKYKKQNNE